MTPLRVQHLLHLCCLPSLWVLLLAANASAQSSDNIDYKVWAAVAFINHGEKTPTLGGLQQVLTPEGAQQLSRQGSAFRSRYLSGSNSNNATFTNSSTTTTNIQNLPGNAIDNSQLTVLSKADQWVAAGALAFMQTLYPPALNAFSIPGGGDMAQNLETGTNQTNYPMGGYQYPNIQTLSLTDPASTVIQGTVGCSAWDSSVTTAEKDLADSYNETQSFYQGLFSTPPLKGVIPLSSANYGNAYDIYEYVNYMNIHNETVNAGLLFGNDTIKSLQTNAFGLEFAKNSNNATADSNSTGSVSSIAGRTLAKNVIDSFSSVTKGGASSKLTLIFGSFEPMIALLSLSGLYSRENLISGPFSTLPSHGAAMIFELIGQNSGDSSSMPSTEDLLVRFTYRASADVSEPFSTYPLFASGYDGQTIPYTGFLSQLQPYTADSSQWCSICAPAAASWCSSASSSEGTSRNSHSVKPAIAGVIGAAVTLAVVGIVGLALYALGICRVGRSEDSGERGTVIGGFKGAEKMPSDADVAVSKAGVQHERIGSWELRDGTKHASTGSAGIITTDLGKEIPPLREFDDEEDGVSLNGVTPVKARESL